ncbi:peptide-methionine (S)-S-oxide reductase MsrA [Aquimarina sp. 2201CG5-10]|uniref:peptide-methionine (S)-S-oxide reductase MsrA n=1 Tax=Aquimarina callyspongiae TaxID=3098150 RepID=UPI0039FCA9A9
MNNTIATAIFGGGCFWCTEAIFQEVEGVVEVLSGYSAGNAPGKPTYREVCSGLTGHAEVIQVKYKPEVITYGELLVIFMTTHDPTSLNRQGADRGTQYRSIILYNSDEEKEIAEEVIKQLQPHFSNQIVTELAKLTIFYEAEVGHQEYYKNNPQYGYCTAVIEPKLVKFRERYQERLKTDKV